MGSSSNNGTVGKAFVCEMCGSNELIKKDGVFMCQNCGTKYSIEEARKLMIEGSVDVSGSTVKVDTSDELVNLYQLARRARDEDNAANGEKYYEMILVKDPNSWEAQFYTLYFRALSCKIAYIKKSGDSINNSIGTIMHLIRDHVADETEKFMAVNEVTRRCIIVSSSLYMNAKDFYASLERPIDYIQEMVDNCFSAFNIMYTVGNYIDVTFNNNDYHSLSVLAWKDAIIKHAATIEHLKDKESNKATIEKYANKIRKYEPSYQPPSVNVKTGACYIATAVYGSYDCEEVWTLRRFRDYKLAKTFFGRLFIKFYYSTSPTLIRWFGHKETFKKFWKTVLDSFVRDLNKKGYDSTPYND